MQIIFSAEEGGWRQKRGLSTFVDFIERGFFKLP